METIPTAQEIYFQFTKCIMNHKDIKIAMIEFAKLHVTEALRQAADEAYIASTYEIRKETIIKIYSLDNIK